MTDPEYQQFESRVVEWVAEWRGNGQLAPDSLINGKPIRADGDDAVELLQHLEARSGTAFGDEFEFQRYFGSEALLYNLWQCLRGKWPWRTRPLSISAVAQYLYCKAS